MKNALAAFALAAVLIVGLTLLTGDGNDRRETHPSWDIETQTVRPTPTPRFTAQEINRQEQPDARRRRAEARVFDRRPLLNALPTTLAGVRFEIDGLAADERTTIISAQASGLGRRRARIAYESLRRRTGDRSRSYRLVIQP